MSGNACKVCRGSPSQVGGGAGRGFLCMWYLCLATAAALRRESRGLSPLGALILHVVVLFFHFFLFIPLNFASCGRALSSSLFSYVLRSTWTNELLLFYRRIFYVSYVRWCGVQARRRRAEYVGLDKSVKYQVSYEQEWRTSAAPPLYLCMLLMHQQPSAVHSTTVRTWQCRRRDIVDTDSTVSLCLT